MKVGGYHNNVNVFLNLSLDLQYAGQQIVKLYMNLTRVNTICDKLLPLHKYNNHIRDFLIQANKVQSLRC